MRFPRARWSVVLLATLLNFAGSPMAWANVLHDATTAGAVTSELATSMAAASRATATDDCHGHAQVADAPSQAPDSMDCCDGSGCYCAAPALAVPVIEPLRPPHLGVFEFFETSALPANPLDDSLRPPIR
jgi:hypothetical protein